MRRLVTVLAVMLAFAGVAPAHAYAGAFFHTQAGGNRGADVLAIQYLLRHSGQSAPTNGVFDSATTTAVRAFQTAKGLGVDGIVGPLTWGALAPSLSAGSSGDAVRALQVELNAKRRLSLAVNGTFDAAVTTAVRNFQSPYGEYKV